MFIWTFILLKIYEFYIRTFAGTAVNYPQDLIRAGYVGRNETLNQRRRPGINAFPLSVFTTARHSILGKEQGARTAGVECGLNKAFTVNTPTF